MKKTTFNDTIQRISEHAPKARNPQTKEQFGYFLAGLIDGDGHITKCGYVTIAFHNKDASVAYYIKQVVGYGSVKQILKEGKAAYLFTCSHSKGIKMIGDFIRNKLKITSKIEQFNSRLVPKIHCQPTEPNTSCLLENRWLAGFIQAAGGFQVKMLQRLASMETQIVIQIDQKDDFLLKQIQQTFGGYISFCNTQKTYYYSSVSFCSAVRYINYLDRYQVMGATLTIYWLWRKAYLIVQDNKHYESAGIQRLARIKQSMTLLRS